MGILERYVGKNDEFALDQRIFHALCLVLSVTGFLGTIIYLLIESPLIIVSITFGFTFLPQGFYFVSRYLRLYSLARFSMLFVGYVLIFFIWFYTSGINGYAHLILFSLVVWQQAITKSKHFAWFLLNILVITILVTSSLYHPEWVKMTNLRANGKLYELLFTYFALSLASFLIIRALVINYQEEKVEIKKVNDELIKVNILLKTTIERMEKIDQTKNKLFSVISHDIRSVAGPIAGLSEVMLEVRNQNLDDKQLKTIGQINESSRNLNVLLENLLAWARIQMDTSEVNPITFNLNEVIRESINAFKTNLQAKKQHIIFNETDIVVINADVEMIKSIVRNLISNAIKFSYLESEIEINLSINKLNETVDLAIIDHGIGLAENDLINIHDRQNFFSRQGTIHEKGSGLGFNISQDFAAMNGGSINIQSKVNEGSNFTLLLPLQSVKL